MIRQPRRRMEQGQATLELAVALSTFFPVMVATIAVLASILYVSLAAYTAVSDCAFNSAQVSWASSLYTYDFAVIGQVENGYGVTFKIMGSDVSSDATCMVGWDTNVYYLDGVPTLNWLAEFTVPFQKLASWW